MKHFTHEQMFRGKPITAEITVTDCGVQVGLYGGDKPHIGAVGVADPAGKITVTQFEGHKEGGLCQHWCEKLFKAVNCPVVVSAGIHYDNASKKRDFAGGGNQQRTVRNGDLQIAICIRNSKCSFRCLRAGTGRTFL